MLLIGENIHIISNRIKEAFLNRDEEFIKNLILMQSNMDYIDLNVGPARMNFSGTLSWLTELVVKYLPDIGISFDTTNLEEMISGFKYCNNSSKVFINSTSNDSERFDSLSNLAFEKNCNIIALTMSKDIGIPKTSEGRLEIAFDMHEKFLQKDVRAEKIYFDPLVLPLKVEQNQAKETIDTIKLIKESFGSDSVKTIVGLSNISNGCPKDKRTLINKVFAVLCFGAGLDAAIIDASDLELVRIIDMLKNNNPKNNLDYLYIRLAQMISNFEEIESVEYNKDNEYEKIIIKTASIILGKEIYSDSFTQI